MLRGNKMKTWISITLLALVCIFRNGDATFTGWSEPSVATATGTAAAGYSFAENTATGSVAVAKTIAATGGTAPVTYSILTTGTPFSIASSTGVLSLDTALDFETTASYTIEIQAVDADPSTGTATVTITVTDVNEAPTFSATSSAHCIADASAAGSTLTTVTATDQDSGDTITYSIAAAGNTNTDFSIASTGVITVATGKTLAASTTAGYALQVEAVDNDAAPLIGTASLFVLVQSCSGSATLLASSVMVLMMSFITLLK